MVDKTLLHQRWSDIRKYYGSMKQNVAVLYERGFSFEKIIMFSKVENIFLCAVFFMLDKHDMTVEGMVSSFGSAEKTKYDNFVNIFRMIESEDYRQKLTAEDEAAVAPEPEEGVKQEKVPDQTAQKSRLGSQSRQEEERGSRKRVRFAGDEGAKQAEDDQAATDGAVVACETQDAAEPHTKRPRPESVLYTEQVAGLVSELRTSINDYTLLLLELDQQHTRTANTGLTREQITAELSSALRRLRQYDDAAVRHELGRGAAPALCVQLHGDLERFRFKRYEVQSRLPPGVLTDHKAPDDSSVFADSDDSDGSADIVPATPLEQQLAQRIDAVRAVVAASLDGPDGHVPVSTDTLDRAVKAGVFISRRCEQHLTAVLARATELCVVASDATRAARERLLELEERGETGPEQEVGVER